MKLLFIYGLPGVGKLTTARALSTLTGIRLFDNHVSFNLVRTVFDFPSRPFLRLLESVRLATFDEASREGLQALIFTFVYAAPDDDGFVEKTIEVIERHGGDVAFVRLHCTPAVNEERVAAEGRREAGKISTVESLRSLRERGNLDATIPFRPGFEIDNSTLGADEVARRIVAHYALPMR